MFNFTFQNPTGFFFAFVPSLLNLWLVLYIVRSFPKNILTNLFALLTLCEALWQLNDAIGRISITDNTADLWDCFSSPAWIFIGPLCLHFSLLYAELIKPAPTRKVLLLLYGPAFVFMALYQSRYYPHVLEYQAFWGWVNYHNKNIIETFLIYWISILVFAATAVLFYRTFTIKGDKILRKQSLLISAGIAIPTFTGILTQVIFPTILKLPAIPVTSSFMTFFSVATVRALKKYKLFSVSELISNEGLIEYLPVIVISITEQRRIIYINTFGKENLGLWQKDFPELNIEDLFYQTPVKDRQVFENAWLDAGKGNKVENIETKIMSPGGKMDIIFSLNPIINNNRVHGYLFTARDITELKRSGRLIKNKEILLAEAQQLSHIGSWEWDIAPNTVSWTDELFRIYGYQPDEIKITYETFLQHVHPDDREAINNTIQKTIAEHRPFSVYHRIVKKNGETVNIHSQGKITLDENNNIIKMTGTAQDVTESKNKEEILKTQNEELHKINSELDRFVYSVSHDLRAPLTSMLGIVAISEEEASDPGTMERLGLLKTNIKKLDKFILDILNYSRNSRLEIQHEEIDFTLMLNDIISHIGFMGANQHKVDIKLNINGSIPFHSDKTRVNIILTNIISNAIRYCNPAISNPFVKIMVDLSSEKAIIKVCDNGIGIDEKQHRKIFEMFYRASDASTGSGLGLYIANESVKKLRGNIKVDAEPGKGATFIVTIPNN